MRAPETWLLGLMLVLLAVSLSLLWVEAETAVRVARGVCVALTILLLGGVIVPARRYLRREARNRRPPAPPAPSDREPREPN